LSRHGELKKLKINKAFAEIILFSGKNFILKGENNSLTDKQ
jgi:hypothetical protein